MQKQKEKSEKVKAILKKSLDIFCYIMTALAVTLGIAMGVNSCSGSNELERIDSQQVETPSLLHSVNPDDDGVYVYEPIYTNGSFTHNFNDLRVGMSVPTNTYGEKRNDVNYSVFLQDGYFMVDSGEFESVVRVSFYWVDLPIEGSGLFEYVLRYVWIITSGGYHTLLTHNSDYSNNKIYTATTNYTNRLVLTGEVVRDDGFNAVFKISDKTEFTFNAGFNYNAPFGLPYNAVYGSSALNWSGGGDVMKYISYDVGWFWSNGRIFNTIKWWAMQGDGVAVVIGGQATQLPAGDNWLYTFMYYENSLDGTSVLVNMRDSLPYNGGASRYYANTSTWQVPAYRNIVLLSTPTQSTTDLLGSFNNNNVYDSGISGGAFADVFSLVGSAFTGLIPILSLQILPYVTIGTLLFVPLVAILVFAIIRIIKK